MLAVSRAAVQCFLNDLSSDTIHCDVSQTTSQRKPLMEDRNIIIIIQLSESLVLREKGMREILPAWGSPTIAQSARTIANLFMHPSIDRYQTARIIRRSIHCANLLCQHILKRKPHHQYHQLRSCQSSLFLGSSNFKVRSRCTDKNWSIGDKETLLHKVWDTSPKGTNATWRAFQSVKSELNIIYD